MRAQTSVAPAEPEVNECKHFNPVARLAGQQGVKLVTMDTTRRRPTWDPQRRRFLAGAVAAAALPAISCSDAKSSWRCLTADEGQALLAICECLIPTDEYPGAAWAGAVHYIDLQLYGHFRKHRSTYRSGVAALDQVSREQHGRPFAALGSERQVELLKAVEKGQAPASVWKQADQRKFFSLVLAHTMESYYGDPRHGGNRDQVGYRMIGVPATPVRGRSKHDLQAPADPGKRS
jgi:gluconate 2-dehydrogenase gamma chain